MAKRNRTVGAVRVTLFSLVVASASCASPPYVYPSQYTRQYRDLAWSEVNSDGEVQLYVDGKVIAYEGPETVVRAFEDVPVAAEFARRAKEEIEGMEPRATLGFATGAAGLVGLSTGLLLAGIDVGEDDEIGVASGVTLLSSLALTTVSNWLSAEPARRSLRARVLFEDAFSAYNEAKIHARLTRVSSTALAPLSRNDVIEHVTAERGSLEECIGKNGAVNELPEHRLDLLLSFDVQSSGAVVRARVETSYAVPPETSTCLSVAIESWKFRPSPKGANVTRYAVTLLNRDSTRRNE